MKYKINRDHQVVIETVNYYLILFFIFIGIFFILIQFSQNKGQWLDEILLSRNIINLDYRDLLKPLNDNQVAPILYLLIQKTVISIFGETDLAFRVFPLACTFISAFFLYQVCLNLSFRKYASLACASLFLLHPQIIYYSSEAKQYPIDVFASISLIYLSLILIKEKISRKRVIQSLMAAPLFYLSNVMIILSPAIATLFIFDDLTSHKKIRLSTVIIGIIWATTFISYYFFFINGHSNEQDMLNYWKDKGLPKEGIDTIIEYIHWGYDIFQNQLISGLFSFFNSTSAIVLTAISLSSR